MSFGAMTRSSSTTSSYVEVVILAAAVASSLLELEIVPRAIPSCFLANAASYYASIHRRQRVEIFRA
jgi:hypothetical protein